MRRRFHYLNSACAPLLAVVLIASATPAAAWNTPPIKQDPLLFMPGSQSGNLTNVIAHSSGCANCHGGYNATIAPSDTWQGSMMAQATRDPLWLACVVVANQDSIWALGTPNAADLCLRCHTPGGWLAGRSDPPNLSLLTTGGGAPDFDGVNCDTCHRMVDPMNELRQPDVPAETTQNGTAAANATYEANWQNVLRFIRKFDGTNFYDNATRLPASYGAFPSYTEATSGQYYILDSGTIKRGPRFDSEPKSKTVDYSRFHKSKSMCATCHDVSNPVLANLGNPAASQQYAAGSYYHVERTWSEFQLGAFAQNGGSATSGHYAGRTGVSHASACQDCHMPATVGKACNKQVPTRNDLAIHDLSGGNTWVTRLLASADDRGSVYDAYNYAILSGAKYPAARIDVAGLQNTAPQLLAGELRARTHLQDAASLDVVEDLPFHLMLRIVNHTGHKLISGFPEGRRMWLNIQFLDGNGSVSSEINPYSPLVTSVVNGNRSYESGGTLQINRDDLVYEAKMASTLTGENSTFHFVLATGRYKDNRIPPRGFDHAAAPGRLAQPRWHGLDAPDYFTESEYTGGYDEVRIDKPAGTVGWRARLYYQSTSKEYVEFLRDEILGVNKTLGESPTPGNDTTSYVAQSHNYFSTIKDWGLAIYDLWLNNGGSPPELMASAINPADITGASHLGDSFEVRFATLPGRSYQVQFCDSLTQGGWTNLGSPIAGDGTTVVINDPGTGGQPQRFYRVESSESGP